MAGTIALFLVCLGAHPHFVLGPAQLILLVMCLLCELTSATLPVAGRWSGAWALCLGTAALCPSTAALALLLAVGLRSLQSSRKQAKVLRFEAQETLGPAAGGLALAAVGMHWPISPLLLNACALAVGLSSSMARPPAWASAEEKTSFLQGRRGLARRQAGMALLGWCAGQALASPQPWLALPLGVAALAFQVVEVDPRRWVPIEERTGLQQRLEKSDQEKLQLNQTLGSLRGELQTKLEERLLLEELSARLAQHPDLNGTAEVILSAVRRLLNCQSCVLFQRSETGWEAAFLHSPQAERLRAQPLLRLTDPLLEEAALGRAAQRNNQTPGPLFPGETYGVALPVGADVVLYAGGTKAWPKDSLGVLTLLAHQASLALWVASRFQYQQQDLSHQRQTNRELQAYAEGVNRVLRQIEKLLADLSPDSLIEQMPECISAVFGGSCCALCLEETVVMLVPSGNPVSLPALCAQSRRATWWQNLSGDRFVAPLDGAVSALVAPLPGDTGSIYVGGLLGAFQADMVQWLEVFAFLFGGLLHSSRLHAELVTAYQSLQDSQAQVAQASKMAAVGQLAAGVAHEINNPLAAVLLAVDSSIKMKDRPQLLEKLLGQARSGAARCTEIVAKLLYYSREARMGTARFSLPAMIADTLDMVGRQLQLDGVQVELRPGPPELMICANQNGLHQVLLNLLINARDAVLEEPGRARQIVISYGQDGELIWFEVHDQGVGMDPTTLSRCLEPFYTTKPVGRGTGLGLSVSHQIVQTHKGELRIQSQPDAGTSVRVCLPAGSLDDADG